MNIDDRAGDIVGKGGDIGAVGEGEGAGKARILIPSGSSSLSSSEGVYCFDSFDRNPLVVFGFDFGTGLSALSLNTGLSVPRLQFCVFRFKPFCGTGAILVLVTCKNVDWLRGREVVD